MRYCRSPLDTLLLCICLMQYYNLHECYTINDTYSLLKDKLANYNRKVRPTLNQSAPTEVSFRFQLIGIQEFDERQEKLSLVAVLHLNWVDEMVQWNPSDYDGIYTILTENELFWKPNLLLANTASKLDKIGDDWQTLRFLFNGTAYYYPLGSYSSTCSADITLYPWDIHICSLQFTPQGHLISELTIKILENKAITTDVLDSGTWELLDSKVETNYINNYMAVDISLLIERRPRFAVLNMVLPLIFLAFLGSMVFLVPPESGERISYSITMLLAIAVFLTLVGDNLPKTSTPMSYFSFFLIALFATSICISLATIYNMRIYYTDESENVDGIWKKIIALADNSCRKKSKQESNEDFTNGVKLTKKDEEFHGYLPKSLKIDEKDIGKQNLSRSSVHLSGQNRIQPITNVDGKNKVSIEKEHKDIKIKWKDVSVALDKFFFLLFNVIIVAECLVFLLLVLTSERAKLDH